MNLRAMVAYGLTPFEALTTATRAPGEVLGEPLGRIDTGMYADLVVLGGDPLSDIKQAANVRQVMANGVLFDMDTLLAPFTAAPSAKPASVMVDPVPDHPDNGQYWWHDAHYVAQARYSCCVGG